MPIAVKDMILTRDMPTTAGSKILEGWIPPYNGTVIERISRARMPILGKRIRMNLGWAHLPNILPTKRQEIRGI